jgi:predicted MPP superfamily phosphohydrolase
MVKFIVHNVYLIDWLCLLLPCLFIIVAWFIRRRHQRWAAAIGIFSVAAMLTYVYGRYYDAMQLEVRHVEYASADLPEAFDGYRIVQFSDIHVGSMNGRRQELLRRTVDSINAQHPDAVVFTGDLLNASADEAEPHRQLLSTIKAPDGIYSVLGNHDYAEYIDKSDPAVVNEQLGRSRAIHYELGWHLLCNAWSKIRRDSASIVIAGMENDGEGRFPQLGDHNAALYGLGRDVFVVMLEHDPTSWRRRILPHTHVQLTLSGHTHGGQLNLFGWSPASLRYHEHDGMYYVGERALNVSKGVGGVIPFRLGAKGEIVVITLKSKKVKQ